MGKLTARDVMEKRPEFIGADDFMTRARQLMRDHHHRTLPVVNGMKKVLGIITEKDILNITSTKSNVTVNGYITETPVITSEMDIAQAARLMMDAMITRIPVVASEGDRTLVGIISIVDIFNNLDISQIPGRTVEEFMSTKVKTCFPVDSLAKIWMNMIQEGYSGFPVVDKHNKPIGMITRYDIIRSGGVRIEREDEHGSRIGTSSVVSRIMSTPPFTISPDAPLNEAIEMMIRLDVGRLLVTNPERLVGIIDRHDIVRAYLSEFSRN